MCMFICILTVDEGYTWCGTCHETALYEYKEYRENQVTAVIRYLY